MNISVFELLFFVFIAFAWPFSTIRMIRAKSTRGKSVLFSIILLLGYLFGIGHKIVYAYDWVIAVYIFNTVLVISDIMTYFVIKTKCEKRQPNGI